MKITILGSGSKGNSTLLEFGNTKILIDVGFNYKTIKEKLESINVFPKDIDYIFISHDHYDHICGLKTFINKHKTKVYMSEKIADIFFTNKHYENLFFYTDEILIEDIFIKIIPTSHDAIDSNGFLIEYNNTSIVYITDTGYIHKRNLSYLKNKNYYILESNHDIEMLINGKYPYHLQKRIASNSGHLSNDLCAGYLSQLIGEDTQKVILAHLSEENNTPALAYGTVKKILNDNNVRIIEIECANQNDILEVVN